MGGPGTDTYRLCRLFTRPASLYKTSVMPSAPPSCFLVRPHRRANNSPGPAPGPPLLLLRLLSPPIICLSAYLRSYPQIKRPDDGAHTTNGRLGEARIAQPGFLGRPEQGCLLCTRHAGRPRGEEESPQRLVSASDLDDSGTSPTLCAYSTPIPMMGSIAWGRYRDGFDHWVRNRTCARRPAWNLLGVQFRRRRVLHGHGRARRDGRVLATQEGFPRLRDSVC